MFTDIQKWLVISFISKRPWLLTTLVPKNTLITHTIIMNKTIFVKLGSHYKNHCITKCNLSCFSKHSMHISKSSNSPPRLLLIQFRWYYCHKTTNFIPFLFGGISVTNRRYFSHKDYHNNDFISGVWQSLKGRLLIANWVRVDWLKNWLS